VRDIADIEQLAAQHGLVFREAVDMPANNMILAFVASPLSSRTRER
jgi:hypothetical protein